MTSTTSLPTEGSRLMAGRQLDRHDDHPVLFLQHFAWHEGYHHGQITLALSAASPGRRAGLRREVRALGQQLRSLTFHRAD